MTREKVERSEELGLCFVCHRFRKPKTRRGGRGGVREGEREGKGEGGEEEVLDKGDSEGVSGGMGGGGGVREDDTSGEGGPEGGESVAKRSYFVRNGGEKRGEVKGGRGRWGDKRGGVELEEELASERVAVRGRGGRGGRGVGSVEGGGFFNSGEVVAEVGGEVGET